MFIANRLADLRRQFGYSKEDLADILQVEDAVVYEWERGESVPNDHDLERLSSLYQVPVDSILTNEYIPMGGPRHSRSDRLFSKQVAASFPILILFAFFGLGFVFNLWAYSWLLFLAIPLYYIMMEARKKGEGIINDASFPIIVVAVYLIAGMIFGKWHPGWIVFLTIPLYYTVGKRK